ncbi:MAG: hypothetical protein PSV13_07250 [Lacunisphaera sp.]|nr:hypothetical protein [Lacunisphaera sp.]
MTEEWIEVPTPAESIRVGFTAQKVSGRAGLASFAGFLHWHSLGRLLQRALPARPERRGPGRKPLPMEELALGFITGVLAGAQKLAQVAHLRADPIRNVTITDNQFLLDFEGDAPVNLFSLEHVIGLNFSGNVCEITTGGRTALETDVPPRLIPLSEPKAVRDRAPAPADLQLPDLILARDCRSVLIHHNIFKGTYRHGLRLEGELRRVLVSGNDFADARGKSLSPIASDNNVIIGQNFV